MPKNTRKSPSNQPSLFDITKYHYSTPTGDVILHIEDDDMWASQKDMSQIFNVTVQSVGQSVSRIIKDDKIPDSAIKRNFITATDNKRYEVNFYNLDVMLTVGYRANSVAASEFRKWANGILRDYLTKGIVINPLSPKAQKIKRQLDLIEKVWSSNEYAITRLRLQLDLIDSLKSLNAVITQVVDKPEYGNLTNAEYIGLFGATATGLKTILGSSNVRDDLGNQALATLRYAEATLSNLLLMAKSTDMKKALAIYQEALAPIRAMHDGLCEQFGIHPITGEPLLSSKNL